MNSDKCFDTTFSQRAVYLNRLFIEAIMCILERNQVPEEYIPTLATVALNDRIPTDEEWRLAGKPYGKFDFKVEHESILHVLNMRRQYTIWHLHRNIRGYFDAMGIESEAVKQFNMEHGPGSSETWL